MTLFSICIVVCYDGANIRKIFKTRSFVSRFFHFLLFFSVYDVKKLLFSYTYRVQSYKYFLFPAIVENHDFYPAFLCSFKNSF